VVVLKVSGCGVTRWAEALHTAPDGAVLGGSLGALAAACAAGARVKVGAFALSLCRPSCFGAPLPSPFAVLHSLFAPLPFTFFFLRTGVLRAARGPWLSAAAPHPSPPRPHPP
jgi:hypothetical protein